MSHSNKFLSRLPFTRSLQHSRISASVENVSRMRRLSILGQDEQLTFWSVVVLLCVHAFGVYSMFGLAYRNGYYDELIRIRDHGPLVLPGSDVPVLTRYTGVPFTDMMLALANILFANVTDGSAPWLSIYGFQFAGQLVPVFIVFMVEGIRFGHCKTSGVHLASFHAMVWGCFFQSPGYAFVMPLYAIANLLMSPTAQRVEETVAQDIRPYKIVYIETIIPSMIIAYVVPTILMCWPFRSSKLHQVFNAIWQCFPVWVFLTQYGLVSCKRKPVDIDDQPLRRGSEPQGAKDRMASSVVARSEEMSALHRVYLFAFTVSTAMHLGPISLVLAAKVVPLILYLFKLESLTFYDVFVPTVPWSNDPMESMALAMTSFFQYDQYVGSTAALVWAFVLHLKSRTHPLAMSHCMWLAADIMVVSVVCGPGASLMVLLWNRDERVLSDENLFLKQDSFSSTVT